MKINRNNRCLVDFFKGSIILVISNICLKAINFFLLPLYTKYLTPDMLGVSDTITTFTGFLLPILTMGMDSAYSAFYFDETDKKRKEKVFSTVCSFLFVVSILPMIAAVFSNSIANFLFNKSQYGYIVRIALFSVCLNLWYIPFALELRLKNKMMMFGVINIISSFLMIMFNVVFVTRFHFGESALVISLFCVQVIQLLLFGGAVHQLPPKKYVDKELFVKMFTFSLPLIPMTIMNWILTLSDRYVLLYFKGQYSVGLYGISSRFVTMVNVIISAISTSYTTFAFSNKENKEAKKQYALVFQLVVLVLLVISFTVSIFSKEIVHIMASAEYRDAYVSVRDLMFAQTVYAMTTIVGYGLFFEKKSKYSLFAISIAAIVNVVLNFILIPYKGIVAAALTTLIGYILQFVITYYFSEKVYPCDYKIKKILFVIIITYIVSFVVLETNIRVKLVVWVVSIIGMTILYRKEVKYILLQTKKVITS